MENWMMPSAEEARTQGGSFENHPLCAEDYIVKIGKVELDHYPQWNQTTNKFDPTKTKLEYQLVLLPYKLKAEDGLKDVTNSEVPPLTKWLWKKINPFSIGSMPNGSPTYLRALIAYTQEGVVDVNGPLKMPGLIVLDKNDRIITEQSVITEYKENFSKLLEGTIGKEDFKLLGQGYKHITDIHSLEGKYISIKVEVDQKGRNKIVGFSKVPSTFVPDADIEKEAITTFKERFAKLKENREANNTSNSSNVSSDVDFDDSTVDF